MAVTSLLSQAIGFIPSKNMGGGSGIIPLREGAEAASQSWKKGAVLIESSGSIAAAAADAVADILGVAAGPATGTTGAQVLYYPATPGMIFECTLEDQSNQNHVLAQSNIYANYAVQVDNDGIYYADENDTTNTAVVIVGAKDALGTTRARVYVQFEVDKTSFE